MIGRREPPSAEVEQAAPMSFDDFDLRLGDIMRGERATMGKSLLDVQRELKIKASFVAAIENADASAFETPGFVAGYVRSYARYLGLEPEWAFETFCREADFVAASTAGKLGEAPVSNKPVFRKPVVPAQNEFDPFAQPRVSFVPKSQSPLSNLEPRAIGSLLVLLCLIGGVGYGGWSVFKEVQQVTVTPVDRAPVAVASVDPIDDMKPVNEDVTEIAQPGSQGSVSVEHIYRPQPLPAPVMISRDGPIAVQDPTKVGVLGPSLPPLQTPGDARRVAIARLAPQQVSPVLALEGPESLTGLNPIDLAVNEALGEDGLTAAPRVTEGAPEVVLVAVESAWVRVRAADGSVLLEKILDPGDTYVVPQTEEPAILRTGAAGAVFFAVNGQTYGPAGGNGQVVDKIALTSLSLTADYALADPASGDRALEAVKIAEAMLAPEPSPLDAEVADPIE